MLAIGAFGVRYFLDLLFDWFFMTTVSSEGSIASSSKRAQAAKKPLNVLVMILFASFLIPLIIHVGTAKIFPYRAVLLILFPIVLYLYLVSGSVKKSFADLLIFIFSIWVTVSMFVWASIAVMFETAVIFWVETITPYLAARCLITTPHQFYQFCKLNFFIVVGLIPLNLYENFTGTNLFLVAFGMIGETVTYVHHEMRFGLDRAQGPFDHPILLGVYCCSFIGTAYFAVQRNRKIFLQWARSLIVFLSGFLALSSGPLAGAMVQFMLIVWDNFLRKYKPRWKLLIVLVAIGLVVLEIGTEHGAANFLLHYFAFNAATAYNRLLIWEYGWQNVLANPVLGIGFGDWERPRWMTGSFDMYWLVVGLRHGLPAMFANLALFFFALVGVCRCKFTGRDRDQLEGLRLAYAALMIGVFIAGWSVHFWGISHVCLYFFIGSGLWMISYAPHATTESEVTPSGGVHRSAGAEPIIGRMDGRGARGRVHQGNLSNRKTQRRPLGSLARFGPSAERTTTEE